MFRSRNTEGNGGRCKEAPTPPRHCEERSDEAIHLNSERNPAMDCRVGLRPPRNDELKFMRQAPSAKR